MSMVRWDPQKEIEALLGRFDRSFTLPDRIGQTFLDATFKVGMLTVELPKLTAAKRIPIEVQVH